MGQKLSSNADAIVNYLNLSLFSGGANSYFIQLNFDVTAVGCKLDGIG
jgi:hypothetical protein